MSTELKSRQSRFLIIPAGALIGLGTGIIAGYLLTGFLAGLGAGYLIYTGAPGNQSGYPGGPLPSRYEGTYIIRIVIGIYIVISGFAIIWIPKSEWAIILAVFLIFAGIFLLMHGHSRGRV